MLQQWTSHILLFHVWNYMNYIDMCIDMWHVQPNTTFMTQDLDLQLYLRRSSI